MEAFVEHVGSWMSVFDVHEYLSRQVPYHAVKLHMLLTALLACGAQDLGDQKASTYYDTAWTEMFCSLQNPESVKAKCAVVAVLLSIYRAKSDSESVLKHIYHARRLIRECNWGTRHIGLSSACLWVNIGMEVLINLARQSHEFDPDSWGVDMNFSGGSESALEIESEDIWVHRIFFILAKALKFRVGVDTTVTAFWGPNELSRFEHRQERWDRLKRLCDEWNRSCPRSMRPLGYVDATHTRTKSGFPKLW